MRFTSTTFRETTYNLLTDNQKREFHARAIRYLEKETRKCRACGNGYFTKYMGNRLDYVGYSMHKIFWSSLNKLFAGAEKDAKKEEEEN